MSESSPTETWNHGVFLARLATTVLWTILVFALWILWSSASLQEGASSGSSSEVNGMVLVCTTGICGTSWVFGLLLVLLAFAILRR